MFAARLLAERRAAEAARLASSSHAPATPASPGASDQEAVSGQLHQATKRPLSPGSSSPGSSLGRPGARSVFAADNENAGNAGASPSGVVRGFIVGSSRTIVGAVVEPTTLGEGDSRYFWSSLLRTALAHRFDQLSRSFRIPVALDSGCSGLGAELWVFDALQIPTTCDAVISEPCGESREILLKNHISKVHHAFSTLEEQARGEGFCHRHGKSCCTHQVDKDLKCVPRRKRRHLFIIGTPCQPFSSMSVTNRAAGGRSHPLYYVTFGHDDPQRPTGALDYIRIHLPHIVIFEQVESFGTPDRVTQEVPLAKFVKDAKELRCPETNAVWYTAIHALPVFPGKFLDVNRNRCRSGSTTSTTCTSTTSTTIQHYQYY